MDLNNCSNFLLIYNMNMNLHFGSQIYVLLVVFPFVKCYFCRGFKNVKLTCVGACPDKNNDFHHLQEADPHHEI